MTPQELFEKAASKESLSDEEIKTIAAYIMSLTNRDEILGAWARMQTPPCSQTDPSWPITLNNVSRLVDFPGFQDFFLSNIRD